MNTSLKIKHNSCLTHFSRRFTVEFWIKIFSTDVDIFMKDILIISLQNNQFILVVNNKIIPPVKVKDYQLSNDVWTHLTLQYKKKEGKFKILLNCEEVVYFNTNNIDDIGKKGEIVFGNENLEGEITEIRIWNQVLPIKFLIDNHKAPLPILAESKRKVKMKINKHDEKKKDDKGVGFRNQSFLNTKFSKPRESGFLNQSGLLKGAIGKKSTVNTGALNNVAFSQEIPNNSLKKENPVTVTNIIKEENFKFEDEVKYPGFTFEAADKGKSDMENFNAPSFISVIQNNKEPSPNIPSNFNPNDFNF